MNCTAGMLGCEEAAEILRALCPGLKIGTSMVCCTVSIQKVASIFTALAFALAPPALLSRNAMLEVPSSKPALIGSVDTVKTTVLVMVCPLMAFRRTVFGSSNIA